jgi:hypothetical protein
MTTFAVPTSRRNHRFAAGFANVRPDLVAVVTLVRDHVFRSEPVQQRIGSRDVMSLTGGQVQANRSPFAVDRDVEFAAETAPRSPESLVRLPPFAPAACWWARITVESKSRCSRWASPPRASRTRPQTPFFDQRKNRWATLFHLPNRSGKSRQGTPVRAIQTTAFTNKRLSSAERPGSVRLPGRSDSIRVHCSGVNSCRRIGGSSLTRDAT